MLDLGGATPGWLGRVPGGGAFGWEVLEPVEVRDAAAAIRAAILAGHRPGDPGPGA